MMLRDIIRGSIGFQTFQNTFKSSNVNGIYNFLKRKDIQSEADFNKLDDIEARHLIDQIIMYSSLAEMRLHQIEKRIGKTLSSTDQRQKFGHTLCCMPED